MERLMQSRIKPINPVHATCGVYRSRFIPLVPIQLAKKFPRSSCLVMDQRKSFNSVVASVQFLEASTMGHFDNALPSKEVLDVWRTAEAVCFNVDSTVCQDEGIDELADFCRVGKVVAEWISPGIEELVKKLKAKKKDVYLISGGFRQMINGLNNKLTGPVKLCFIKPPIVGSSICNKAKTKRDGTTEMEQNKNWGQLGYPRPKDRNVFGCGGQNQKTV
ncbi:hypothetical protein K2173_028346 [Erythroxylum novogranatense]|uniref:phosphoserine phosphatase n=1 Tax=Erythroxylum novogranatense TaxID=1862640 RepID=A0AAV8U4L9_9ROSI|nr:hypothetical protein K2173_028346 [Erythroxylum novogranatense]